MHAIVRFYHETSSCKLLVWDKDKATLSNLFSRKRGQGHAKEVMRQACRYADKQQLTVILEVQQYQYADSKAMDNAALRRFYERFGFVWCGRNMMQRTPSQELHAS